MSGFFKSLFGGSILQNTKSPPAVRKPAQSIQKPEVLILTQAQVEFYRYCHKANRGVEVQRKKNYKDLLERILANPKLIGLFGSERTLRRYAGIPMPTGETAEPEYMDAVFFLKEGVYVCTVSDASFSLDDKGNKGVFQAHGENYGLAMQRVEEARNYVEEHFKFKPRGLVARTPENSGLVIFQKIYEKRL